MTYLEIVQARAGFWRRLGALVVDYVVVMIPLQILVAILFAQTNGVVQGSFGIIYNECQPVSQLPEGLTPQPPPDATAISECRTRLFGFDTARSLVVSKLVQNGNVTSGETISYALNADGQQLEAFDTSGIALLTLAVYLIFMEWRSGETIGKRALGIRTVETSAPGRLGLPLRRAVIRYLAMWIGLIPAMLFAIFLLFVIKDPVAAMGTNGYWFMFALAAAIQASWLIWIVVSISKKRDPTYDRIAGTSVMRTG